MGGNFLFKIRFGLSIFGSRLLKKRMPLVISWMITGRCRQRCLYCKVKRFRRSPELNTAQAKDMIKQLYSAGTKVVSFTGGELLLRSDIGELINEIKLKGLACKLNSNGLLVKERINELLLLDLIQISIDGPPNVNDRLRGTGCAEEAAQAVISAKKAGIPVQLITCLTKDTVRNIREVLKYGLYLNTGLCFQPVTTNFLKEQDKEKTAPEDRELIDALDLLVSIKKGRDPLKKAISSTLYELVYYRDSLIYKKGGCACHLITATITPDGMVMFCGNAKKITYYNALSSGFYEAFSRLSIPECDGCVCVGKLRLSGIYSLNLSVIRQFLR